MKYNSYIFKAFMLLAGVGAFTSSCEDMLESDSKFVIYDDHLTTASDTASSLVGIIYKLQAIAERTHLLGEVRGDLVTVKTIADASLRKMASFEIDDDNTYNNPRDYYAVINNCNYFIANADLNAKNSSGDLIFWKEYVQAKTIRAWTYLQLALNYGSVPFYTDPILTETEASLDYPKKSLVEICDYFIGDLSDSDGFSYSTAGHPGLATVGSVAMSNCMFPVDVVMGDLYLWRASLTKSESDYREAAKRYFSWILRKGYAIEENYTISWGSDIMTNPNIINREWSWGGGWLSLFSDNGGSDPVEMQTIIPMDSLSYQGYFNNLRYMYENENSTTDFYISPSARIQELSQAQDYGYYYESNGLYVRYDVPESSVALQNGDLRLTSCWKTREASSGVTTNEKTQQTINKSCSNRHIWIYRRTDLFLRLAEALNNGGFPRFAYSILANGLSPVVIEDSIEAYCNENDVAFIEALAPNNEFNNYAARAGEGKYTGVTGTYRYRTIGIHSRGSGYAELNPNYAYPVVYDDKYESMKATIWADLVTCVDNNWDAFIDEDLIENNPEYTGIKDLFDTKEEAYAYCWENDFFGKKSKLKQEWAYDQMEVEKRKVDQMILDEMALETCFEGKRFYDLMRHAYRYNDNSIVADPVSKRTGEDNQDMGLYNRLMDEHNWFMSWKGKIGL